MTTPKPTHRWYCFAPYWLILALLVVEALLLPAERFVWLPKGWLGLIAVACADMAMLLMLAWFTISLICRRQFQGGIRPLLVLMFVVEGVLFVVERLLWLPQGWTVLIAVASIGVTLLLIMLLFAISLVVRWPFRFSLRSLLVLVIAVAIPCSWLGVEMKAARKQREVVKEIEKLEGSGIYPVAQAPAWLRSLVGDDFFESVILVIRGPHGNTAMEHLGGLTSLQSLIVHNANVTDAGLAHLEGLPKLECLQLHGPTFTDAGIEHLKGLITLKFLALRHTTITDVGLAKLTRLPQLQALDLGETPVTDAGLEHLKGLPQLQSLDLWGTKVTDAGLEHLKGLPRLQSLKLSGSSVTDAEVKRLQKALPNCEIKR